MIGKSLCFIVLLFVTSCATNHSPPSAYSYKLGELRANRSVMEFVKDGWSSFTFKEPESIITWVFTPDYHYAHPSFAKRESIRNNDGSWIMKTVITCGAVRKSCIKLREEFGELDKLMLEQINADKS